MQALSGTPEVQLLGECDQISEVTEGDLGDPGDDRRRLSLASAKSIGRDVCHRRCLSGGEEDLLTPRTGEHMSRTTSVTNCAPIDLTAADPRLTPRS